MLSLLLNLDYIRMSCGCKGTKMTQPKDYTVHQLTKIGKDECGKDKEIALYPLTLVQAVTDACTGERLDDILVKVNHLYLQFKNDFRGTMLTVSPKHRRRGLVVTTKLSCGSVKSFIYEGKDTEDCTWKNKDNWREVLTEDKYFVPDNLRIEDNEVKLDIKDNTGTVVNTLKTLLPNLGFESIVTNTLPNRGKNGVLYLVPNAEAPGTHREFVWVDTLNRYEQLGSASGSCGNSGGTDTFVSEVSVSSEGDLILTMNTGVKHVAKLPTVDPTLKQAIDDLKTKHQELQRAFADFEDENTEYTAGNGLVLNGTEFSIDTTKVALKSDLQGLNPSAPAYDDTEIKSRISALEAKEDQDTVYDDAELKSRVKALEDKPDKDTKYTAGTNISISEDNVISASVTPFDPSEINRRLTDLESRPNTEGYNDTEIKNRISALESKTDIDTIYDDTEVKNRLSVLENKEDKDTKYTAGQNITISSDNVISANVPTIDLSDINTRLSEIQQQLDVNTNNITEGSTRITALESRTDRDTVYDDTEIRNLINTLTEEINKLKKGTPPEPTPSEAKLLMQYIDESEQPKTDKSGYTELYSIPANGGMHEMDTDNDFTTEVFLVPSGFIISRIDGPLGTQTPPSTSYIKIENLVLSDGKTYSGWRLHANSGNGTHLKIYIKKA